MFQGNGADTLSEEIVEEEVTQVEAKPGIESKDGHSEDKTGSGKEVEKVDYEARYKELQAFKDKQIEELKKKLDDRNSDELKKRIEDIDRKMSDPTFLEDRLLEAKKKAEEEEGLSAEAREIRKLQKSYDQRIGSLELRLQRKNAEDAYVDLKSEDQFFEDNEAKIASMLEADSLLRLSVMQNPHRAFKMIKGLIISEDPESFEKRIEQKILDEHSKRADEARKKKTSVTSPAGSPPAPTKNVGHKDHAELIAEYRKKNPVS